MFKNQFNVTFLNKHSDRRGDLFEVLRFKDQGVPGRGYIYCFTVKPGQRRGHHYHKKKKEWFCCISGKVIILLEDRDGNKKKITLDYKKPAVVYCPPYTVHTLYNNSKKTAIIVSYGSRQHEKNDPDTFVK